VGSLAGLAGTSGQWRVARRFHIWSFSSRRPFYVALSDSRPTVCPVPLHDCLNLNYFGQSLSGHSGVSAPFSV
jgi:hypothetical protein